MAGLHTSIAESGASVTGVSLGGTPPVVGLLITPGNDGLSQGPPESLYESAASESLPHSRLGGWRRSGELTGRHRTSRRGQGLPSVRGCDTG